MAPIASVLFSRILRGSGLRWSTRFSSGHFPIRKCGSRFRTCVSHTGAKSASTFDMQGVEACPPISMGEKYQFVELRWCCCTQSVEMFCICVDVPFAAVGAQAVPRGRAQRKCESLRLCPCAAAGAQAAPPSGGGPRGCERQVLATVSPLRRGSLKAWLHEKNKQSSRKSTCMRKTDDQRNRRRRRRRKMRRRRRRRERRKTA